MKIATTLCRILLGLLFVFAGGSSFYFVSHSPPLPPEPLAHAFQAVFFASRMVLFVGAVELVAGLLLLVDRFVPLALVTLIAVIYNILVFHLTMQPGGIVAGLVALALWIVVAVRYRASFAPLLRARPDVAA